MERHTMLPLLNDAEQEASIETRFADGKELFDREQSQTRMLVLRLNGIARFMQRNVHVNEAFGFYLRGAVTLSGAMLLAVRSLEVHYLSLIDLCEERSIHGPWPVFNRCAASTIEPKDVMVAVSVTETVFEYVKRVSAESPHPGWQAFCKMLGR